MIETCLFLDIETLPTVDPDRIAEIAAQVTVPGNYRKAESIAKWEAEEKPQLVLEAVAKTSFEGGYGRIASIAHAAGDEPVQGHDARPIADMNAIEAEKSVLVGFWAVAQSMHDRYRNAPCIIGHNVQFDIRFLWKRSIVLDIPPPSWWPVDAKSWDRDAVVDTMTLWEGHGGRISQDRLARMLGLAGKDGFDGSQVAQAWAAGEFEKVRVYNKRDVDTVRRIWKRITGYQPPSVAPAFETQAVDVGPQSLDRPIRTGVRARPVERMNVGFRPAATGVSA